MDVSGGNGQPRSGDDEPAERPAGPTAPATGPTDRPGPGPERHGTSVPRRAAPQPDRHPDGDEALRGAATTPEPQEASARPEPAAQPWEPAAGREDGTGGSREGAVGREDGTEPRASTPRPDPGAEDNDGTGRPGHGTGTGAPTHDAGGATRPHSSEHRSLAHSGTTKDEPPRSRPKEPGGGILMGRPFGVPVYVAPSWFLVAALITWVFGGQLDRVLPELGAARYLVSLFFAVAFYASVLVHELAHTVAAIRFKLPVRRIQLQFFGGVSEIEKEAETPGREFVLAFVGPLLSLALAGLFYLAMKPVQPGTVPGVLLAGLMVSNLIVAVFNLLPGLPLDGGRMLRAVVWKITGKPMSGTVAAAWVGRALAVSVLIGLPLLNSSGTFGGGSDVNGMDTVTDALLAAILAAIIWTGAGNSLRMARLREHLPELRARALTRRAVPVQTDTPLSEALRRANAVGARALVVVDADGNAVSVVREAAIVGVPEHRRPWVAVSGLAQELTDGMRVSAELAGEDLLDVLRATPATEYLVVEETGEIYGVLSAADVERAFVRAMARPT
ncbi:peptidase [Streptomyces sp. MUSC 125]|uniref:site-2 protease family protein n=1 Tax=unclassified Streptomyces TaxID=2593676 RepID=UPI00057FE385|nr:MULTISPECIES: site-2 protease family protein [unclassified Streptomyces]KIE28290.1 peptidase [Streptomyces sp. MUSC 125]MCH0555372.1 site-2 protease family protein [Streptomyces sp. MUM 16J]